MKDKVITIRLSNELHNMLTLKASAVNKTTSEFMRDAITKTQIKTDNSKNIGKLIGTINRFGNNINQIAHILNSAKQSGKIDDIDYKHILNNLTIIQYNLTQQLKEI